MIIVNVLTESGCSFNQGEYMLDLEAVVHDKYNFDNDHDKIVECIQEYDGEIKEDVVYTFFLNRANIQAPFPHYDPSFDIWQVLENVSDINIQL